MIVEIDSRDDLHLLIAINGRAIISNFFTEQAAANTIRYAQSLPVKEPHTPDTSKHIPPEGVLGLLQI